MYIYRAELGVIAKNSLRNCHIKGMDSVMFDNTPGRRVRAFIVGPDHDMWKNLPSHGENLSLSIHPHHCDIELSPLFGPSYNLIPYRNNMRMKSYPAWQYRSQITQGDGGFEPLGPSKDFVCALRAVPLDGPWEMRADELHTWYVPQAFEAAWLVREGRENPNYDSTCWSDADLTKFDMSQLYQPMDTEYLLGLLDKMKVHVI